MPKTHRFNEEQYAEVVELSKRIKAASLLRKLQVLQLRMEGYSNAEIARITRYSKSRVSAIVCIYANEGIAYFREEQRKGGNHRNLSYEIEEELLSEFEKQATDGHILTVEEIKRAYEERVGHRIGGQQIYRVLRRHGWRKVMPRSKHPNKASEEAIEASKKLTPNWEK